MRPAACRRSWRPATTFPATKPSRWSRPMSDRAPAGAMALPEAPEICAILTTYNRAHLLPRVLEGLEAQRLTKDRFEIVVIDDGSTDQSRAVLAAWSGRLPMRILHQAQSGLAAAKNM